tara:strand:- start:90 stop:740 length:651 start_codon:yes stop_codon:yes gene_type:complete
MKIDVDTKQRLTTALIFLTEFYKVLMGTFLGVFIPLKCEDEICSVTDNIYTTDPYHVATNIYNLISFILVISFYVIELRRENWSIEYLDIDETKSLTNLDTEVEKYPMIKTRMKSLNLAYYRMIHVAIFMLTTNFILSGLLVGFNYYNINTLNSILSFFMLVFMKLNKARGIATASLKNEQVCSGFLTAPKIYNTIDVDYRVVDTPEISCEEKCVV